MRILGIDPGTNVLGYSILDVDGNHAKVVILASMQLERYADHYGRLKRIFERMNSIIEEFKPDELAIEAPFFGKNVQSMLKLGRAQGVCMAAALSHDMPVTEYAPMRVKQAVTGNGMASKEQVAAMLQRLLRFSDIPHFLDATDALAIAYAHFISLQTREITAKQEDSDKTVKIPKVKKSANSWDQFLRENPDRIRR